jgi:hypothetical protein
MQIGRRQGRSRWRGFVGLAAGLAVLCTMLVLFVTIMEAWREHLQAQWPQTTARIQQCDLELYQSDERHAYYIACRIAYRVGAEEIAAEIRSGFAPSPGALAWPDPRARLAQLQNWVDQHPPGMPISVHYDPSNPQKAVLVATDMPLGGPRTPANLRLLGFSATICALLLPLAWLVRPPSGARLPS